MFKRMIIIIAVLIGIAFLIPSNPYTDKFTAPTIKSVTKVYSYINDKAGLSNIELPEETTTIHKWQDKDGNWHFSNTESPRGVDSESKIYKDGVNVMPITNTKTEE